MFDLFQLSTSAPLAIHSMLIGGLVILLRLLQAHLTPQDFFRFWTLAWTAAGLQLALGWTVLHTPSGFGVRLLLALAAMVAGYAAIPLLVFGTRSLTRFGLPPRGTRRAGYALALLAGGLSLGVSVWWGAESPLGVAIRRVPLQAAAGASLIWSAVVVSRQRRRFGGGRSAGDGGSVPGVGPESRGSGRPSGLRATSRWRAHDGRPLCRHGRLLS